MAQVEGVFVPFDNDSFSIVKGCCTFSISDDNAVKSVKSRQESDKRNSRFHHLATSVFFKRCLSWDPREFICLWNETVYFLAPFFHLCWEGHLITSSDFQLPGRSQDFSIGMHILFQSHLSDALVLPPIVFFIEKPQCTSLGILLGGLKACFPGKIWSWDLLKCNGIASSFSILLIAVYTFSYFVESFSFYSDSWCHLNCVKLSSWPSSSFLIPMSLVSFSRKFRVSFIILLAVIQFAMASRQKR